MYILTTYQEEYSEKYFGMFTNLNLAQLDLFIKQI